MSREKQIANYLINRYEKLTDSSFGNSELKLQKLMYYIQKHSYAFTGKPMFEEDFIGWVHGPVLRSLRHFFDLPNDRKNIIQLSEDEKYVIDNVIEEYGGFEPWKLRDISHSEKSWIKSRKNLNDDEKGERIIPKDDIIEDAKNIRLYDHIFDMYVDEFEDAGNEYE